MVQKEKLPGFKTCLFLLTFIFLFLSSFLQVIAQENQKDTSQISHVFYILSNTGPGADHNTSGIIHAVNEASTKDLDASLLLLGNITGESAYPFAEAERKQTQEFLQKNLLQPLKGFNGNIIFAPGVNEWQQGTPQSLDDLESFLQKNSDREFWPDDGCPVEEKQLSDEVVLITVDSQWYFENWDKSDDFNLECEIRSRERFFVEIKDDIKDNHGKIKVIAVHHPVLSSATPGFFNKVFPFSKQNFENPVYRSFRKRLETLASQFDDVIFVSGNHKNLQYLHNGRNPQIISATAGKTEPARAKEENHFASEKPGYAKLTVFKNGNSRVDFFGVDNSETSLLFSQEIEREMNREVEVPREPCEEYGEIHSASIYTPKETDKSAFHKFLWGEHYREIYSKKIEVPVLYIDSLNTTLEPLKEGGGQQSRSIRFIDADEHEFTLRALRKSPVRYLQADLSPENYIGDMADNTIAERIISDFYTTSHPYAKFALDKFAGALDLPHIQPKIFFLPKQTALRMHNDEYGDALYEMQAHAGDENKEFEQFGNPDDILSTHDLLEELREEKDAYVDEKAYLKARLLDMLVGDWDRHQDQFRWAEYEEDGGKRYVPIPRDRDHAFSKYDGPVISALKLSIPLLRKMQSYGEDIQNIKWFNWSGYPLDLQILYKTDWAEWEEQVKVVQNTISDELIELAFNDLPEEAQDQSIDEIKEKLRGRRANLMEIAEAYFDRMREFVMITGTEDDDRFEIVRQENGKTFIIQKSENEEVFRHTYDYKETRDIWIYGLDGEDEFVVSGKGDALIRIRILGGAGHDTYDFQNRKKVKLYDFKSSENTIKDPRSRRLLVDSYDINGFHYEKFKYSTFKILPYVNFETDLGFTIGVNNVWTKYGLVNNPFQARHELLANYYFDTSGFALKYTGEFAHLFYNWNLGITAGITSPNYTLNYFGSGDGLGYDPAEVDKTFNRVKVQKWHFSPSLIWRNDAGSVINFRSMLESFKVEYEPDTFLGEILAPENDIFDTQFYAGVEANYRFYSKNNSAFPSLGSDIYLNTGYKKSIDNAGNEFGYVEPVISFNYPLISSGYAVFATKIGGEMIFGDDYEIYHAATIGGNQSLRGYRNHRFNGKQAFYHSTDLRTALGLWKNKFLPIVYGVTAGFDYGRVWTPGDDVGQWHNNYGGSIWISAGLAVTGNIGLYHGRDGNRLSVMLNFKY
jgi:hypothetical protein